MSNMSPAQGLLPALDRSIDRVITALRGLYLSKSVCSRGPNGRVIELASYVRQLVAQGWDFTTS